MAKFAARGARWPTEDLRLRLLARRDESTVAIGQLTAAAYAPPDHQTLLICPERKCRRSGFGLGLLARLKHEAGALGYAALTATVPETAVDALAWAEHRGFRHHVVRIDSILDISNGNSGSVQAAAVPSTDVSLHGMTVTTEPNWHEVLSLFRAALAEAPDMKACRTGASRAAAVSCATILRLGTIGSSLPGAGGRVIGLTVGHAMGKDV